MKQNVYIASIYAFIPLHKLAIQYKERFDTSPRESINMPSFALRPKVTCHYVSLKEKTQPFYYTYRQDGACHTRKVDMHVYILKTVVGKENPQNRFYLVIGTSIDKVFPNPNQYHGSFSDMDLCTPHDITYLKKAFYQKGSEGFHYPLNDPTVFLMSDWLDSLVTAVSGIMSRGEYGRHYLINILGVNTETSRHTIEQLTKDFEESYFSESFEKLHNVIPECDSWAYGLIFGNDNYQRVDEKQIQDVISHPFSNNTTERTYAGDNTIVFIGTHYPYSLKDREPEGCPFSAELKYAQNIQEICTIMNVRRKLKNIGKILTEENAPTIKEALRDIAEYIANKPSGLRELDWKMEYFYEAMGINKKFDHIKMIGELSADATNLKNTNRLNILVTFLTGITVVTSLVQIFFSNNFNISLSDMCNCISIGTCIPGECYAVIMLTVCLLLTACIVVLTIYQVRAFYKLEDFVKIIKRIA